MVHVFVFVLFVAAVHSSLMAYGLGQYGLLVLLVLGLLLVLRVVVHSKRKIVSALVLVVLFAVVSHLVGTRARNADMNYEAGFTFAEKTKATVVVEISEFPNYKFTSNQYVLRIIDTNTYILTTAQSNQKFGYLDRLEMSGVLSDVRMQGTTWAPYYRKIGVQYTMFHPQFNFVAHAHEPTVFERIKLNLFALKTHLRELTVQKFSSHASALVLGMLLGERDELSKEEKDMFNRSGISHILVVSGYNISLMITFVFAMLAFVPWTVRIVVSLLAIILFVLLVGLEPSVVRAALMGSIILFAKISLRPSSALNVLFLVAALMLTHNPYSIFDAGFHLSFIATFALLIMPTYKKIPESVLVTAWVFMFVSPYILYLSGSVSLAGIASNLAIVFLLPIFMLGSLASLALAFLRIPLILDVLFIETMSRYIFAVAHYATRTFSSIQIDTPPSLVTAAYLVTCFIVLLPQFRYTTREFIELRYPRFVPQRPS
jgi:competence protein ComEC